MMMVCWELRLDDVHRAVEQLHDACAIDGDSRRASTAAWLDGLFADVVGEKTFRQKVGQALMLYTGGMGSFQDVGSATMAAAVDALHSALRAAARAYP
ncbi:hypothetical protein [Corynebacterium sp. A21]|uniref:hypothetical protein n=1 Tax=Corynebacterium sp. A21 TaxID=3457318 RepID=UPI003FCF2993